MKGHKKSKDVTAKVPDENDKNFENKKEVYLNEPENIDNKHLVYFTIDTLFGFINVLSFDN